MTALAGRRHQRLRSIPHQGRQPGRDKPGPCPHQHLPGTVRQGRPAHPLERGVADARQPLPDPRRPCRRHAELEAHTRWRPRADGGRTGTLHPDQRLRVDMASIPREQHDRPSLDPTFQRMTKNATGGPPSAGGTPCQSGQRTLQDGRLKQRGRLRRRNARHAVRSGRHTVPRIAGVAAPSSPAGYRSG